MRRRRRRTRSVHSGCVGCVIEPRNDEFARAETVVMVERNMCNAVMRGTVIPPGSRSTSRAGQISPSTNGRAVQGAGSCLHLASVLQEGRKSAHIYAKSAVVRGIPVTCLDQRCLSERDCRMVKRPSSTKRLHDGSKARPGPSAWPSIEEQLVASKIIRGRRPSSLAGRSC